MAISGDTMEVKCPCCDAVLVIERRSGKVLEERRPIAAPGESTGSRYDDAMKKVTGRASEAEKKFQQFQAGRADKAAKLDALFKDTMDRVKDSGDTGKVNPFEHD